MTRGIFGQINKKGAEIAASGLAAREAGNMPELAKQIARADKLAISSPIAKGATLGEAAALPIEARATMDFGDANALPPDSGARVEAEKRLADWPSYVTKGEQNLASGAIGALGGALLSKYTTPQPGVDLGVLRSYASGIPGRRPVLPGIGSMSPDVTTPYLRERARIAAGVPPVPQQSGGTGPGGGAPIPLTGEVLPPAGGGAPPVSLPPGASGANQSRPGLPPPGGAISNRDLMKALAENPPANRNVPKAKDAKADARGKYHDPDSGQYMSKPKPDGE